MTFASTLGTDIQQTLPTSDTTIRSALLTSLQPIGASRLFLNPVADEYPELAERYLAVIKEPVSVREIKYRLNNKTTRYHVLYEVYHDLALLTHNCLLFNPHNDFLRDECAYFEKQLLSCVNSFLFKINCLYLTDYRQFAQISLYHNLAAAERCAASILHYRSYQTDMQVTADARHSKLDYLAPKPLRYKNADVNETFVRQTAERLMALPDACQHVVLYYLALEMDDAGFSEENDYKVVLQIDLVSKQDHVRWLAQLIDEYEEYMARGEEPEEGSEPSEQLQWSDNLTQQHNTKSAD